MDDGPTATDQPPWPTEPSPGPTSAFEDEVPPTALSGHDPKAPRRHRSWVEWATRIVLAAALAAAGIAVTVVGAHKLLSGEGLQTWLQYNGSLATATITGVHDPGGDGGHTTIRVRFQDDKGEIIEVGNVGYGDAAHHGTGASIDVLYDPRHPTHVRSADSSKVANENDAWPIIVSGLGFAIVGALVALLWVPRRLRPGAWIPLHMRPGAPSPS
jgi:Protein of unknown function (DUF3592)